MSAEVLRSNIIRQLAEAREKHIKALRLCKYQPAVGTDKGIVPAVNTESIALYANQTNAWIEAIDMISELVEAEARKIMQPESGKVVDIKPEKQKRMY